MYWTLELAYHLDDAPWPATKEELIDYAIRSCAPLEVVENLSELDDDDETNNFLFILAYSKNYSAELPKEIVSFKLFAIVHQIIICQNINQVMSLDSIINIVFRLVFCRNILEQKDFQSWAENAMRSLALYNQHIE